ncbi:calcium-translocating P-type ATPase [Schizopora paradoxa]|uniref:Calcium-transporting ATPase 2 n=1 Tax=Schizopora paradoxa TaxID=27342 RepID=A0A0H2RG02_9AGAM|nr:calcium-translocating P-type ATPase [Schizopora paradoxa]
MYDGDDAHSRRTSITLAVPSIGGGDRSGGGGGLSPGGTVVGVPPSPRPSHASTRVGEDGEKDGDGKEYGKGEKGGDVEKGAQDEHPAASSTSFLARIGLKRSSPSSNSNSNPPPKSSGNDADEDDADEANMDPHALLERMQASETTDPAPFPAALAPLSLAKLVDPKSVESLREMGGVRGVMRGLGVRRGWGVDVGDSSSSSDSAGAPGDEKKKRTPEDYDEEDNGDDDDSDSVNNNISSELPPFTPASLPDRQRVYGRNALPSRASKSLLQLMWLALKDKVLVLLTIAAVVSLALGLFQDFGTPTKCTEPPVDWVEGVAIMVAVIIVVGVGSVNDWQKERQFKALNDKKEDRTVKVIRGGRERVVNVKEVVVGDIALLEPGEIVPCDGIFLEGHNVKCDESGLTGESDAIKKMPYATIQRLTRQGTLPGHTDCFIVSGSKVLEGVGSYVVIAVGPRSFNGRILLALARPAENTPLQAKLNWLAELIAKLGSLAGLLLFVALLIRFFVQLGTNNPVRTANQKGLAFVQILIISVTLIVVAVPEGLPLAVTLALAFATKRMTKEKLLVRVLGSCETMANASVVCTDKTGTLTRNEMSVVAGSVGIHAKFVRGLSENEGRANVGEEPGLSKEKVEEGRRKRKHPDDFALDQSALGECLGRALEGVFNEAIAVNSTAFEDVDPTTGQRVFVGSKTETALLAFAKDMGWEDYARVRERARVVQMIPFSSERKAMGVVVKIGEGRWRVYLKGASEILTKKCERHVVVTPPGTDSKEREESKEVETREIDELSKDNISRTIIFYANQMLRTIAVCYRDLDSWPPKQPVDVRVSDSNESNANPSGEDADSEDTDEVPYELLCRDLTLIGITGIEDPLREGVREAVAQCQRAGVQVKMCTGDNVLTARSIATQCGIFTPGGIIMEGPVFRQLPESERLSVVPRLQVLARSSPTDKEMLVDALKELGEVVGVTGDGTNDGPALKSAHVGFSMGIAGTEVAKEASDIILMDDNFASIVKAIMWGRCVNDAVRKFLQFQISVNITAVIVTFATAVASASETSALSAVQLLWINIIMDTFAALALATDPASMSLLDRKPEKRHAPLFSVDMYKQILGQSAYQTVVILVFHFAGNAIFNYVPVPGNDSIQINNELKRDTLVFNAFVFAQIFNSINSRRIDNKLNVFEGILRNYYFIIITLIEIAGQVLIIFVGSHAFQVTRLNGRDWGISLALGVISLPLGALIRCIPNEPVERLFVKLRIMKGGETPLPTVHPAVEDGQWNDAIMQVKDNLHTFANVRGGRMRGSSFVGMSRKAAAAEAAEKQNLPSSIMTMVPTLVVSSIAAGWAPAPGSLSDPAHNDPSRSSSALWEGKMQIHPETDKDDPIYKKWGGRPPSPAASPVPPPATHQ